ncbi:hypothetical protein DFH09DRAFT_1343788 [Mycena vulgaris]|nr:hypothetical protein DFH09DRAFT_1343788 [Mycena vulgaris]
MSAAHTRDCFAIPSLNINLRAGQPELGVAFVPSPPSSTHHIQWRLAAPDSSTRGYKEHQNEDGHKRTSLVNLALCRCSPLPCAPSTAPSPHLRVHHLGHHLPLIPPYAPPSSSSSILALGPARPITCLVPGDWRARIPYSSPRGCRTWPLPHRNEIEGSDALMLEKLLLPSPGIHLFLFLLLLSPSTHVRRRYAGYCGWRPRTRSTSASAMGRRVSERTGREGHAELFVGRGGAWGRTVALMADREGCERVIAEREGSGVDTAVSDARLGRSSWTSTAAPTWSPRSSTPRAQARPLVVLPRPTMPRTTMLIVGMPPFLFLASSLFHLRAVPTSSLPSFFPLLHSSLPPSLLSFVRSCHLHFFPFFPFFPFPSPPLPTPYRSGISCWRGPPCVGTPVGDGSTLFDA